MAQFLAVAIALFLALALWRFRSVVAQTINDAVPACPTNDIQPDREDPRHAHQCRS